MTLAETGDIVITTNQIDASFISYLQGYGLVYQIELLTPQKCGRDLADSILLDESLLEYLRRRVRDNRWSIETFLYGQSLLKLADKLSIPINGNPEFCARYGTKSGFRRLAERLGIPIPTGLILDQPTERQRIRDFVQLHTSAILKEDDTLGGYGVTRLTSTDRMPERLREDCLYVIEKEMDFVHHGSIQVVSRSRDLQLLLVETHAENYEFKGFVYPPAFKSTDSLEQANKLFSFLRCEGFHGFAGIDFAVDREGNVFFHDLNLRKTAVSYSLEFVKRVLGPRWRSYCFAAFEVTLRPAIATFREVLDKGKRFLLSSENSLEGIILCNAGLIPFNRIGAIAISKYGRPQQILDEFRGAVER